MKYLIGKLTGDQSGQSLGEYALILALVVIICIAGITFIGTMIKDNFYEKINDEYPGLS
jgi:Flp pilus assembly pilin Flp